jgi:hypothetical protein
MAGQKRHGSLGFKGRCTEQSRSQAQSRRGRLGDDYVAMMPRPRDPGRDPNKQRWTGCDAHQGLDGVYCEAGSKAGLWRGDVGRQVRFTATVLIPCLATSGSQRRGTPGARLLVFDTVVVLDGSGTGSCSVSLSVSVLGAAFVISGDGTLSVTRITLDGSTWVCAPSCRKTLRGVGHQSMRQWSRAVRRGVMDQGGAERWSRRMGKRRALR